MGTDADNTVIHKQAILRDHDIFPDMNIITIMATKRSFDDGPLADRPGRARRVASGWGIDNGRCRGYDDLLQQAVLLFHTDAGERIAGVVEFPQCASATISFLHEVDVKGSVEFAVDHLFLLGLIARDGTARELMLDAECHPSLRLRTMGVHSCRGQCSLLILEQGHIGFRMRWMTEVSK